MSTRRVTRSTYLLPEIEPADLEATPRPRKIVAAKRTVTTKANRLPVPRTRRTLRSISVDSQSGSIQSEEVDDDHENGFEKDAHISAPVPFERPTTYGIQSLSRQSSVLDFPSARHASPSNSIRLGSSLSTPRSTLTTPPIPPVASKGEITTLVFASNQLLALYIDSKNQGLPVNSQREAIFWQLLQATRALFPSPSSSCFLLSAPSVDSSGLQVASTSDPAELSAFRLSDYAVFLHAIAGIRDTVASEAQLDELQEAWRMFLQLFKETNGTVGTHSAFRHDGLLTLLLDIGTQLYILKRPTLSLLQQSQLLDELFSSSLVSRRTSQQGLRTKALKTLDDERWLAMSRARVAELNVLQSNPEARFSFANFQREVINFVQSRQAIVLNLSSRALPNQPDLNNSQTVLKTARSSFQRQPRMSEPIHHVRSYPRNPSVPASVRTSYSASLSSRLPNVSASSSRRVSAPLPQREPFHTPISVFQRGGSHVYSPDDDIKDSPPVRSIPRSRAKPRYSALSVPSAPSSPLMADSLSLLETSDMPISPESPSNKGWEGNDTLDTEELEDLLGKNEEESMDVGRTSFAKVGATSVDSSDEDEYDNTRRGDINPASPRGSIDDEELLVVENRTESPLSLASIKIEEDELINELDLKMIRRPRENSSGSFLRESEIDQVVPSDSLSRAIDYGHSYDNADEILEATFALTRQDILLSQSRSQSQSQLNSQLQPLVQGSPTSSISADFIASLKARTAQLKQDKAYINHARSSSMSTVHNAVTKMAQMGVDSSSPTSLQLHSYESKAAAPLVGGPDVERTVPAADPFKSRQLLALPIEEETESEGEERNTLTVEQATQPSVVSVSLPNTSAFSPTPVNITSTHASKGPARIPYRPPTMTPEPFSSEVQPVRDFQKDATEQAVPLPSSSFPDIGLEESQSAPSSSLTLPVFSQSTCLRRPFNKRKMFDTDSEESDSSIDDSFIRSRVKKTPMSAKILPPSWPSRVTSSVAPPATSPYPNSSTQPMSSMPSNHRQTVPPSSPNHLRPTNSAPMNRQRQVSPLTSIPPPPGSVLSRHPSSSLPSIQPTSSNSQRYVSSTGSRSHTPAPTSSYVKNEGRRNLWSPVETLFFIRVAQEIGLDTSNCWTTILEQHGAQGRYSRVLYKRSNVNLKDKMRLVLQADYPSPVKVPNGMIRYLRSSDPRKIAWLKGEISHAEMKRAKPDVEREVDRLCEQARRRRIELEGESDDDDDDDDDDPEPDLESEDGGERDEDEDENEAEEEVEEEKAEEEEVLDVLTMEKANSAPLFFQGSDE